MTKTEAQTYGFLLSEGALGLNDGTAFSVPRGLQKDPSLAQT